MQIVRGFLIPWCGRPGRAPMRSARVWIRLGMRLAATLGCGLLVASLTGCGPGQTYAPGKTTSLDTGPQYIQIFANGDWRDTGVRMTRGQNYRITAEGKFGLGGICG